jgi:hypothetical protein
MYVKMQLNWKADLAQNRYAGLAKMRCFWTLTDVQFAKTNSQFLRNILARFLKVCFKNKQEMQNLWVWHSWLSFSSFLFFLS